MIKSLFYFFKTNKLCYRETREFASQVCRKLSMYLNLLMVHTSRIWT
jgi:hypothetical protein